MNKLKNIAVVDDDHAIRESLQLLLFAEGLNCQAFSSASEFLESGREDVDCLLLDIRMPGMDGLELFQILRKQQSPFPVIFITGHGDIPLAVTAIKQGAFDFLTKPFQEGELLAKIRSAVDQYAQQLSERRDLQQVMQRVETCTPREQQVMHLMSDGLSNKGIADALNISPRTVEIHRAHVMEKMEAESLPDLVRMLTRLGTGD